MSVIPRACREAACSIGLALLTGAAPGQAAETPPETEIVVGAYVQGDARAAEGDHPLANGFAVRRARLESNGTLHGVFAYKVEADFARSSENLQQGWAECAPSTALRVRVGLFKVPYGMENLISSRYREFTEPSLAGINFNPFIDTGVLLHGEAAAGRFGYALSLVNGEGRYQPNRNDELQYGGRLVVRPFAGRTDPPGHVLVGLSAHREELGNPAFSSQVTALGTRILRFADSLSFDGARTRWGAELQCARGPLALAAEFLELRQDGLVRNGVRGDARQSGGYATLTWLVTGEKKQPGSPVRPERPWRRRDGGIGGWELGLRYDWLDTEEDILESGLAVGTPRAQGVTAGLHLWPTADTRILLDVYHHWFETGIVQQGVLLEGETGAIARLQLTFQATVLQR